MQLVPSLLLCLSIAYTQANTPKEFLNDFNSRMPEIEYAAAEASFQKATNITAYNTKKADQASIAYTNILKEFRKNASDIDLTKADEDSKRQFKFLLTTMTSSNKQIVKNSTQIHTKMENIYSEGRIPYKSSIIKAVKVAPGVTKLGLDKYLNSIFSKSTDPKELLYVWEEWRKVVGPPLRDLYTDYVRLKNIGARENHFLDAGDFKRKIYEVDNLAEVAEQFWNELQPFYDELHAYVRFRLSKNYPDLVKDGEPIPAHLLGNMWAQSWSEIFHLVKPYPDEPSLDVTTAMLQQKYDAVKIYKKAEEFFVSIGWPKLPQSFWKKSMLVQPKDRNVTCHASAWDFSVIRNGDMDVRVKMCTKIDQEDLITAHHELGHIYYYILYWNLPAVYRTGANPGFHEAVGDTLVLSVQTPDHLKNVGLLKEVSQTENADINFLLKTAMERIAFLPFGYLMDQWMWGVYSGTIKPNEYNKRWWDMRLKYQGVKPPTERGEEFFDPGAKFHIPGDTPYIRYFFSHILQFTFHKHACAAAKSTKPLHKCSIYNSKEAGKALGDMLRLGKSVTWQKALKNLTGSEELSAAPINEYFAPLKKWLEKERKANGYTLGWQGKNHNSATQLNVSIVVGVVMFVVNILIR